MDLITHLPTTDAGFDSMYTIADRLSKYIYFMPCTATVSADDLVQLFLSNIIYRHSMPKCIISDHDLCFTSQLWKQLVSLLQYQLSLSTAYYPVMDGQSERFHGSVGQVLQCYVSMNQRDWDRFLPLYQFALNATKSDSTSFSPTVVAFGRESILLMDYNVWVITDGQVKSIVHCLRYLTKVNKLVRILLTKSSVYIAKYANYSLHDI